MIINPVVKGGSGGGGLGEPIATLTIGNVSTSSTSATNANKSISIPSTVYNDYDLLIVEVSVDTKTNNRHAATVRVVELGASSAIGTKNGATMATATWNCKATSAGGTTSISTTAYGVYPNSCSISNNTLSMPIYYRYNSGQTGTINGSYTARVYGVKLYDLIGG